MTPEEKFKKIAVLIGESVKQALEPLVNRIEMIVVDVNKQTEIIEREKNIVQYRKDYFQKNKEKWKEYKKNKEKKLSKSDG